MNLPGPFLEAVNGIVSILLLHVIAWFLYDIFFVYKVTNGWRQFYREAAASIACAVAFGGVLIVRASIWWYRHLENDGLMTSQVLQWTTLYITIGVGVSILGCACIIDRLSPNRFGRWPWATAILSSLVIGIWTAL